MPPMDLDKLKDMIPVEKIDTVPAIQELSKTPANAGRILNGIWTFFNIVFLFICILYFSDKHDTQRDKDDINCQTKVNNLLHLIDSINMHSAFLLDYNHEQDKTIIQLRDSLKMQQLLKHYHITEGKQTIILTPKITQ